MKALVLLLPFFIASCSGLSSKKFVRAKEGQKFYQLKDRTGEYLLKRRVKVVNSKVATKSEVFANKASIEPLEKTVVVSKIGSVSSKKGPRPALRPSASEHVIWFDKKRYYTSTKVDPKNKSLNVKMESPEKEWNGSKIFAFPKGSAFCYFSQLAECVRAHGYIEDRERPREIQIIWDSFPYHSELYKGISDAPFAKGIWAYDKIVEGNVRFGLLVEGQLILYDFDQEQTLRNVYWVAQGHSLTVKED